MLLFGLKMRSGLTCAFILQVVVFACAVAVCYHVVVLLRVVILSVLMVRGSVPKSGWVYCLQVRAVSGLRKTLPVQLSGNVKNPFIMATMCASKAT